jgi:DNA mismatch repair ATPase MutS
MSRDRGPFRPAEKATLGPVDAVTTRVDENPHLILSVDHE